MKYITYINKNCYGRSSHQLKDILTSYAFNSLIPNTAVIPQPEWNAKQSILNFPINPIHSFIKFSETIDIKHIGRSSPYEGISFDHFLNFKEQILNLPDRCLIQIHTPLRIHLTQLSDWFRLNLIEQDVFSTQLLPTIRYLYYRNNPKPPTNTYKQLSIHARRGDISNPKSRFFHLHWDVGYFNEQIINFRQKHKNIPIEIFTEKPFSEDLNLLKMHENLKINRGDQKSLKEDIYRMIYSDFFLPSNSGLSSWISYISKETILMPKNKTIKHFHSKKIW